MAALEIDEEAMRSSNKSAPNEDSLKDLQVEDGADITQREIKDDSRIIQKTQAVRLTRVRTRGKKGKAIKEESMDIHR